jgi:site-specific DNA-methyltransferase (adenine-specific)
VIHHGDCLEVLRTLPDNSVDAVVTDPPYGLSFMGKRWDYDVPSVEVWAECLRVLKPGGHLLAFAGTRTQHRMAVRIEDAGFEIRDMIAWVYGSGFPKSLDVSKAIDKATGAERSVVGQGHRKNDRDANSIRLGRKSDDFDITAPATEAARQWQGWGTALKPALEPITVARKPLSGTVAATVLEHGTGALNVDGCRVDGSDAQAGRLRHGGGIVGNATSYELPDYKAPMPAGRWPANLIHDGDDEVTRLMTGGEARFFYTAKAGKEDRDEGLEEFETTTKAGSGALRDGGRDTQARANIHPTVKPTDLMRYLCRLVTPPGGTVLDPFMGSGSTGKAAILEGFRFIGIEREAEYVEIAKARIAAAQAMPKQESLF